MSTDYRHSITNLHSGVHDDVRSARTRLHEAIELLEHARENDTVEMIDLKKFDAAIDDLRAVEQCLAAAVRR